MRLLILFIVALALSNFCCTSDQRPEIDRERIKEGLQDIIDNLSQNYIYLNEKNVDLNCIESHYENEILNIKTEEESVLFFEYLLDEFYDSHLHLNTNLNSSYRLSSPIYASIINGKYIITNVWLTQIENLDQNIIGAEVLKFNGLGIENVIEQFPTYCNNKKSQMTREWIVNKILAGRYNEKRVTTLLLQNNDTLHFDIDNLQLKKDPGLLKQSKINNIGIIRLNNSLGMDELVKEFDKAMDSLFDTKGIIIDLRNTPSGGDTYEARGIMSRFVSEAKPYQKHSYFTKSENNPDIERSWVEYVSPRLTTYTNPVVVIVGRWTGSMGEGLAIGFEGMKRAEIVGTEMKRLAGEVYHFSIKNQNFGYNLPTSKLYHLNGTIREKYLPSHYVVQTDFSVDESLKKAMDLIEKMGK